MALTGAGAATYVAKKAVDRNRSTIESATYTPRRNGVPARVHIRGVNLITPAAPAGDIARQVSVSGAEVNVVTWQGDTLIDVDLDRARGGSATVAVTTGAGVTATHAVSGIA